MPFSEVKFQNMKSCHWKYCVYPEIITILNQIRTDHNVKLSLDAVSANYYIDTTVCGPIGYCGYSGIPEPEIEKEFFPKKMELLIFELIVDKEWIENNRSLLDQLYTTPGFNKAYTSWFLIKEVISSNMDVTYGLYKKPRFDELFEIMKSMVPSIKTENDLARYGIIDDYSNDYNEDFVEEREFDIDEGCVKTFEKFISIKTLTGKYVVTISVMISDIARNTDLLIKILHT